MTPRRLLAPIHPHASRSRRERGATLIVVLLMLIIVSILGASAVQISLMAERGARNDRDMQIAIQAAEAALMDAEFDMFGPGDSPRRDFFIPEATNLMAFAPDCGRSGNSRGLCALAQEGKPPVWLTVDFMDTSDTAPTTEFGDFTGRKLDFGNGIQPARAPRYIIEPLRDKWAQRQMSAAGQSTMFRVTAIGFGPREDIQAVAQMIYRR